MRRRFGKNTIPTIIDCIRTDLIVYSRPSILCLKVGTTLSTEILSTTDSRAFLNVVLNHSPLHFHPALTSLSHCTVFVLGIQPDAPEAASRETCVALFHISSQPHWQALSQSCAALPNFTALLHYLLQNNVEAKFTYIFNKAT